MSHAARHFMARKRPRFKRRYHSHTDEAIQGMVEQRHRLWAVERERAGRDVSRYRPGPMPEKVAPKGWFTASDFQRLAMEPE